jgi:hypothetical protein
MAELGNVGGVGTPFDVKVELTDGKPPIADENPALVEVAGFNPAIGVKKEELAPPIDKSRPQDKSANGYKLLAELLKSKGSISDDFEINDDIGSDDIDAYFNNKYKVSDDQIEALVNQRAEEMGYTPEYKKYAEYLAKGMPLELANEIGQYQMLSRIDLKTDDDDANEKNANIIIKMMYEDKFGGDPNKLNAKLAKIDSGRDDFWDLAEEAQEYMKEKASKYEADFNKKYADDQALKQTDYDKSKAAVMSVLEKGIIGGIELSKKEIDKLKKAFWEPTESVTFEDNGKKKTVKVTEFDKKFNGITSNPEKNLLLAYLVVNDMDMSIFKKQGKKDGMDEFEQQLLGSFGGSTKAKGSKYDFTHGQLVGMA